MQLIIKLSHLGWWQHAIIYFILFYSNRGRFSLFLSFIQALTVIQMLKTAFEELELSSLQVLLVCHAVVGPPFDVSHLLIDLFLSQIWVVLFMILNLIYHGLRLVARSLLRDTEELHGCILSLPVIVNIKWTSSVP